MFRFRFFIAIFFLFFVLNETQAESLIARKFTVYAYLPWTNDAAALSDILLTYGIQPIKVIYEKDYFTQGQVSQEKIKKIAEGTFQEPGIPVSFDFEFGNRFKPETIIPRMKAILAAYHRFQARAPVGIYAILPQNTYGWKLTLQSYDALNAKYQTLINEVDFLSPSLYNYNGRNFQAWSASARYNIQAAKKYLPRKPIIPYISPIYKRGSSDKAKNGTLVEELDEAAMRERLQLLADLGASGCIIWASSQDRTADGQRPTFSPTAAWGKAVVEFVKTHSSQKESDYVDR